jgi:hypothetical protein
MAKEVVLTLAQFKEICAEVRKNGRKSAFERFPSFSPGTIGAIACAGGVTDSDPKIVERDRKRVAAMLERTGAKLPKVDTRLRAELASERVTKKAVASAQKLSRQATRKRSSR